MRTFWKKKSKFGNARTDHRSCGHSHRSKLEAAVCDMLTLMLTGGEIRDLRAEESVYLTAARIQYIADFSFEDMQIKRRVWAEAKGFETDVWRIKRRLWKHYGPGELRIYKGTATCFELSEVIVPNNEKGDV